MLCRLYECVCVTSDNIMIFHRFGFGAAVCAGFHMSTKAHRNVGGQMWHWHSSIWQRHTHARTYTFSHAFVFNTIYVAGKGTSWWNPLNTLFTEDMWRWREGEEKERGSGKRGRSKKEAQVETLIFRDVWLRLKCKQKSREVFTHTHTHIIPDTHPVLQVCRTPSSQNPVCPASRLASYTVLKM